MQLLLVVYKPSTMFTSILYLSFFLLSATAAKPFNATDYFFLDCGSPTNTISHDPNTNYISKFTTPNNATFSTANEQDPSVDSSPYITARIFDSSFTYSFPVSRPGPIFLRLYFLPATYYVSSSTLNKSNSIFNVSSNGYSLLTNFSPFLASSTLPLDTPFLIKEFMVTVKPTQLLNVTFSPYPNSYAFINGIQANSAPNKFYIRGKNYHLKMADQSTTFTIDDNTALENVYRLNIGGRDITGTEDTGMYRFWSPDDNYIYGAAVGFTPNRVVPLHYSEDAPNYTAPETVYTTSRTMGNFSNYNLTWIFPVDSGFYYLLRLHFCEIQLEVTEASQKIFFISINNQTVEEDADVVFWGGGVGYPVKRDYVVRVLDPDGRRGKQDLWLAMYPNMRRTLYADALLNGLEIFKLNESDGSLAASNLELDPIPSPTDGTSRGKTHRKNTRSFALIIGGVAGGIAITGIFSFVVYRQCRRVENYGPRDKNSLWDLITREREIEKREMKMMERRQKEMIDVMESSIPTTMTSPIALKSDVMISNIG